MNNNNKNDKKLFNTIKGVSSFNIRCQLSHTVATVFILAKEFVEKPRIQ